MKFSLGAAQFYWSNKKVEDYYHQVMASDFDIVYLGETVCSKRRELTPAQWIDLAKQVSASGKQVVLSTLTLVESEGELSVLKKYCDNGEFLIEANDLSTVQLLQTRKLPFVVGPAINCYNLSTLKILLRQGMQRWVMPVELSGDWLKTLLDEAQSENIRDQFECELFAWGHLPLAYSARCFTARSENKAKDDCKKCCISYPQGREMRSQENQDVFVLNGIQTLSGLPYNLVNEIPAIADMGVDIVRLSADNESVFTQLADFKGQLTFPQRYKLSPKKSCNGYWHNISGMELNL